MKIPIEALELMQTGTSREAFNELVERGQADLMTLLTFGFLSSHITDDGTGEQVGIVVSWPQEKLTVLRREGDVYKLIGVYGHAPVFTADDAITFWEKSI